MSRLILKGETVKNFGEFLPAPHIERVYVYDEKITVELSLMLTIVEGQDEEALLERLSELTVNLYLTTGTSRPESLLDKDWHVYTFIALTEMFADFDDGDYAIIDFSEFESIGEYLYDTSGNKVIKLITTVETTSAEDYSAGSFGMLILNAIADGDESELTLFAFSSMAGPELLDAVTMVSNNRLLADQNTSDVAYETIFEDGEIIGQPEMIWMTTPARQPFDGIPLQAIASAKYYTPDHITHKEITESFNELLEEVENSAKLDTVLESVTDSVSYVLEIYGTAPDLLPRLDVLRKAWPDKSSATHTGRLYKRFKGKLHKANLAVARGTLLHKELVLNPKIIDAREPDYEAFEAGEIVELEDNEYLYEDWKIDINAFTSDAAAEIDSDYVSGYVADMLQVHGFFYFDYEKLMNKASNITAFFNPTKINEHYGTGLLNSYLTAERISIKRMDTDDNLIILMLTDLASNPTSEYTIFGQGGTTGVRSVVDTIQEIAPDTWSAGDTLYSYCALRNFAFADGEVDTYRLMCFEFQDLLDNPYDYDDAITALAEGLGPSDWYYDVTLSVTDNTHEVVKSLTSSYYSYYTGSLQDYYDLASEYCSYNDVDGKYNKFYIDAAMAAYADNMEEAPWTRLPTVYYIHNDLLFNTFGGDTALIIDAAKKMSDQINPYAGNLERLENFKEKFESLYDNYYGSGDIPTMMEAEYETDKEYNITFSDLPLIYDSTIEAQIEAAVYEEAMTNYYTYSVSEVVTLIDPYTLWSDLWDEFVADYIANAPVEFEENYETYFPNGAEQSNYAGVVEDIENVDWSGGDSVMGFFAWVFDTGAKYPDLSGNRTYRILTAFAIQLVANYYKQYATMMNKYYWEFGEDSVPGNPLNSYVLELVAENTDSSDSSKHARQIDPSDLPGYGMDATEAHEAALDAGQDVDDGYSQRQVYKRNYPGAAELIEFFDLIEDLTARNLWPYPTVGSSEFGGRDY